MMKVVVGLNSERTLFIPPYIELVFLPRKVSLALFNKFPNSNILAIGSFFKTTGSYFLTCLQNSILLIMRKNGAVVLKSNSISLWKMQKLHVYAIMTARALVIINVRVMGGKYIKMRLSRAHMILVHAHGQKKVLLLHFSSIDARSSIYMIELNIVYIY